MPKSRSENAEGKGKTPKEVRTIAVLTSGGDAPGMNCAIRAVIRTAVAHDRQIKVIYEGFQGLIEGQIKDATVSTAGGIINLGGTILGSARSKEFRTPEGRQKAHANLLAHGIDALVVIGGDGSYHGAEALQNEFGYSTVGVPGTIDNDIAGTDYTIGFDTAVNTAIQAIDKIRDTATSHERLFVVEVMGRDSGFIALETAIGGGAEAVLIPEVKFDLQEICEKLEKGIARGKRSSIIVVAEGAGSSMEIGYRIQKMLNVETRVAVIGHLQRGGAPTALDRMVASTLGRAAVDALVAGETGVMVGLVSGKVKTYPLSHAWKSKKKIDPEMLRLAEILSL